MPEIIDNGETGFVVDTIATAVEAVKECAKLDRSHIRDVFERRATEDSSTRTRRSPRPFRPPRAR